MAQLIELDIDGELASPGPDTAIGRVLAAATAPPTAAELEGEARAVAMFAANVEVVADDVHSPVTCISRRWAAGVAVGLLATVGGIGTAAALGGLPGGMQSFAHRAFGVVGVSVPDSQSHVVVHPLPAAPARGGHPLASTTQPGGEPGARPRRGAKGCGSSTGAACPALVPGSSPATAAGAAPRTTTTPATRTRPVHPVTPTPPRRPVTPARPVPPKRPAAPTPAKPAEPDSSATPGTPANPANPATPATPATPAQAAQPARGHQD